MLGASGVGEVWAVDPFVSKAPEGVTLRSLEEGVDAADIVVILVGHRAFQRMPRQWLREKVVFDVCGLFRSHQVD